MSIARCPRTRPRATRGPRQRSRRGRSAAGDQVDRAERRARLGGGEERLAAGETTVAARPFSLNDARPPWIIAEGPRAPRRNATHMTRRIIVLLACLLSCAGLGAQEAEPPTVEDTQVAGGSSADPPARRLVKWNEYEGPFFTLRASAGVRLDAGTFAQDDASRQQFDLPPDAQVRDFRVM